MFCQKCENKFIDKIIKFGSVVLLAILLFTSCSKQSPVNGTLTNDASSTDSKHNAIQSSNVAYDGESVYFCYSPSLRTASGSGINHYEISRIDSNKVITTLGNILVKELIVDDNNIYFIYSYKDEWERTKTNYLCSMNKNDTIENAIILADLSVQHDGPFWLIGDDLYTVMQREDGYGDKIVKVKVDGSETVTVYPDSEEYYTELEIHAINNGRIYFTDLSAGLVSDANRGSLLSIKINGKDCKIIRENMTFNYSPKYIYQYNDEIVFRDGNNLCKMTTEGENVTIISPSVLRPFGTGNMYSWYGYNDMLYCGRFSVQENDLAFCALSIKENAIPTILIPEVNKEFPYGESVQGLAGWLTFTKSSDRETYYEGAYYYNHYCIMRPDGSDFREFKSLTDMYIFIFFGEDVNDSGTELSFDESLRTAFTFFDKTLTQFSNGQIPEPAYGIGGSSCYLFSDYPGYYFLFPYEGTPEDSLLAVEGKINMLFAGKESVSIDTLKLELGVDISIEHDEMNETYTAIAYIDDYILLFPCENTSTDFREDEEIIFSFQIKPAN